MRKGSRGGGKMDEEVKKGLKKRMNDAFRNGEADSCTGFGVVVLPLCTYRLSQPSVATPCSLFSLKRKIFLFSKFLLFYYLKTVVMMLMTSILLILWKETESCTPFMSAFYILCLVVSLSFFVLFCFFGPNY